MSVVGLGFFGGVVEGVVWVLDEEDISWAADGVVGDIGHEPVEESVVVDVGDIDAHGVGDLDVFNGIGGVGEGAVVVVDVELGCAGVADDHEFWVAIFVHIDEGGEES